MRRVLHLAHPLIVGGFDLSLTGSGTAYLDTDSTTWTAQLHKSKPGARHATPGHKGRKRDMGIFPIWDRTTRIALVASSILASVPDDLDLAIIEAPAFSRIGGFQHERSGLFWIVATTLAAVCQVVEVAPTGRALYATGSGAADKKAVVAAAVPRYRLPFTNDNMVDAAVLATMGARAAGHPLEMSLPASNLSAMNGVLWPTMKGTN